MIPSPAVKHMYKVRLACIIYLRIKKVKIAYRDESKNKLKFLCLPQFQRHHTLRLLLWLVDYIQLQRRVHDGALLSSSKFQVWAFVIDQLFSLSYIFRFSYLIYC